MTPEELAAIRAEREYQKKCGFTPGMTSAHMDALLAEVDRLRALCMSLESKVAAQCRDLRYYQMMMD